MKKMTIDYSKIKPLLTASHEKGINGRKVSKNNPSEWAWAMAAYQFPVGQVIKLDDFKKALLAAIIYEHLSIMVDTGEALMVLDEQNNIAMVSIDD
jgi:hypothetical protein